MRASKLACGAVVTETLEARVVGHRGNVLARYTGDTIEALQWECDQRHPDGYWWIGIHGEYTSDGTHHGVGRGRMLAQRYRHGGWLREV